MTGPDEATQATLAALSHWVEHLIRQPVGTFAAELGRCLAVVCGAAGECQERGTVAPLASLGDVMARWCEQRVLTGGVRVIDVIRALTGESESKTEICDP